MVIVQAISTAQSIDVYAREHSGVAYNVTVIDESLNETTTTVTLGSVTDGLLTINVVYNFIEGRFYSLKIYAIEGGETYDDYLLRVRKDSGTMEATDCLALYIADLNGNTSDELVTFQKIYCTDQTNYEKYSVLEGYYTQPTKAKTEYIVKPDQT